MYKNVFRIVFQILSKNKERLQRKTSERFENLSEKEKENSPDMVMSNINISQKIKIKAS